MPFRQGTEHCGSAAAGTCALAVSGASVALIFEPVELPSGAISSQVATQRHSPFPTVSVLWVEKASLVTNSEFPFLLSSRL